VNCDLYLGKTPHRSDQSRITPQKVRNFVKCDAQYLPFRNNVFIETTCFHGLEHVMNPAQALKELIRVTRKRVYVEVPHAYERNIFRLQTLAGHVNFLRGRWFHKALKNYYRLVETTFRPQPHWMLPILNVPSLIKVTIYLNK